MPKKPNPAAAETVELVREMYGGEVYEYYPLGKFIVAAPGVCGGRPTIKYRRLDARHIIGYLKQGLTQQEIVADFNIPLAAVREVVKLERILDYERAYA